MKTSPGAMVFNRGTMMTNVPLISNLLAIGKRAKTATKMQEQEESITTTTLVTESNFKTTIQTN